MFLKMSGSFEGYIGGAAAGVYDSLTAMINFIQYGSTSMNGKVYLSGPAFMGSVTEYGSVNMKKVQSSMAGTLKGGYTGAFNGTFTGFTVSDSNNPYNGQGYISASYVRGGEQSPARGYAKEASSNVISMTGVMDSPMYGIMQGALNLNSIPPSGLVNVEKLDTSALGIRILTTGPGAVSPGGKYTYEIEVRNEGTTSYSSMTVVARAPAHSDFMSATSGYEALVIPAWRNKKYDPQTYILWHLPAIPVGARLHFNYQIYVRVGNMNSGDELDAEVFVMDKTDVLSIFPNYNLNSGEYYGEE